MVFAHSLKEAGCEASGHISSGQEVERDGRECSVWHPACGIVPLTFKVGLVFPGQLNHPDSPLLTHPEAFSWVTLTMRLTTVTPINPLFKCVQSPKRP